ncbi:head maturation protease [Gordonia phage EMoore]|uniref:RNA ligase n=1 Tax=Gordonia phage EMoore TaxID=2656534 RepID=A0A649VV65_9CAUD|nr:head maturation protease [Gordonia phage EMoore]QGJ95799.1 RNA ligase [Gordonia phage EMoore]
MTISTIGRSLTAAGVAMPHDVFRNPNLERLTPIQVTKDGRVYGHLAGWKTNHIGFPGQNVKPPRSQADYKFFHQGVVPTTEGDLPVGYLTLGTGHAGTGDAVQAAAHYDNTGSQVACVRAGEDEHGIWIAGSVLPGTDDIQAQTLRRSSLSGDWRRIQDPETGRESLELVAALAVNVPGFPIPRTEQLVAAGGMPTMLVAAGIVRNGPITRDEMVAAANEAAREQVRITMSAQQVAQRGEAAAAAIREHQAQQQREQLVASATQRASAVRRDRLLDRVNRVRKRLTAAAPAAANDLAGRMPPELHRYWTTGVGLARWAETPTPYRSLVKALAEEIHDMTPDQINGLAANLYHDVFKQWPGRKSKSGGALTASLLPPTPADARALLDDPAMQQLLAAAVVPVDEQVDPEIVDEAEAEVEHTGGMIALLPADPAPLAVEGGDPVDELHLTLVYLGDDLTGASEDWRMSVQTSVANVLARFGEAHGANGIEGTIMGRAAFNETDDACAVYLVEAQGITALRDQLYAALGDRAPEPTHDAFIPHITAGYGVDVATLSTASGAPVTFDRVRVAIAGENVDLPISEHVTEALPESMNGEAYSAQDFGDTVKSEFARMQNLHAAAGQRRAQTQEGADKYGVSIGDVIGKGVDDTVQAVDDTAKGVQRDVTNMAQAVGEAIFGKRTDTPPSHTENKGDNTVTPPRPVENKAAERKREPSTSPVPAAKPAAPAAPPPAAPAAAPAARDIPADAPPPRKDMGAGTDHTMEEEESPDTGAFGGKLTEYNSAGEAYYDDGSWTDGTRWYASNDKAATPPVRTFENEPDTSTPADLESPDATVTSDVPLRLSGEPGTPLAEDQAPTTGAEGGALVKFENGTAYYDDGTETSGKSWARSPVLPGMGYDGTTMLEDQSPLKGAEGGDLVEYDGTAGVARYSDGTETDGKQWRRTAA